MVGLTPAPPDTTVERITARADERIVEIVAQNHVRMLRHADIVRARVNNGAARPSTVDNVCDFCVRSGLLLEDLPAFRAARRRIHGGSEQDDALAKKVAADQQIPEARAEAAPKGRKIVRSHPEARRSSRWSRRSSRSPSRS